MYLDKAQNDHGVMNKQCRQGQSGLGPHSLPTGHSRSVITGARSESCIYWLELYNRLTMCQYNVTGYRIILSVRRVMLLIMLWVFRYCQLT